MNVLIQPDDARLTVALQRPALDAGKLTETVNNVLASVKLNGDTALFDYTEKFDGVRLQTLLVSEAEIEQAGKQVSTSLKSAINQAKNNIHKFHAAQKRNEEKLETTQGVTCWRKSVGIERVGLYIPGGSAPLFSTILMLGIPASIAGCKERVLCTPPSKDGSVHPAILYTAKEVGVTKIFKCGGAQAIAAMAYGTASVPRVDKIFGPGNQYVTTAKMLVSQQGTAIDMPAGPSEVLVIADEKADPAFVAADLLSQAEHGADSQVVLVTTGEKIVQAVLDQIHVQLAALPRKETAEKALANSVAIVVKDLTQAMQVSNRYAPEHLILAVCNAEETAAQVVNAGSVFLGNLTPESAGDYASGTNHTLPTNGYARAYSGVSLDSFVKKITFQEIRPEGLKNLGPAIEEMAAAEQLDAHKNAVSIRLKSLEK
ncbi:MAG: histidinol dehydrogenase [Flavobacteriales bacterium]|nr:histidinol dehydrogenase [Flavobacteriales bacterium]MCB9449774.1 histidinol dehydrogenase [Flavobacteriales bacterium]